MIFRLAELYFEQANDEYLAATEAYEAALRNAKGKKTLRLQPPQQNYDQTIRLHRRLITDFPDYRLIDGAHYLLGYCLEEMGDAKGGQEAFLALVCPQLSRSKRTQETDIYAACRPRRPNSQFNTEAWVRIGEYHFDENELPQAIAAYQKVIDLGPKDNRYYDEALYKLAWTYYRADAYPEAIRHFDALVVFADQEYHRTGQSGL